MEERGAVSGIGAALSPRTIDPRHQALSIDWQDLIQRMHAMGNACAAEFSAEGLTVNGKAAPGKRMTGRPQRSLRHLENP